MAKNASTAFLPIPLWSKSWTSSTHCPGGPVLTNVFAVKSVGDSWQQSCKQRVRPWPQQRWSVGQPHSSPWSVWCTCRRSWEANQKWQWGMHQFILPNSVIQTFQEIADWKRPGDFLIILSHIHQSEYTRGSYLSDGFCWKLVSGPYCHHKGNVDARANSTHWVRTIPFPLTRFFSSSYNHGSGKWVVYPSTILLKVEI